MNNMRFENINVSGVADPFAEFVGKKLYCKKGNGRTFVAKLIAVDPRCLYFETKDGRHIMDSRDSIVHCSEMV